MVVANSDLNMICLILSTFENFPDHEWPCCTPCNEDMNKGVLMVELSLLIPDSFRISDKSD
jgi:hypothetical protein